MPAFTPQANGEINAYLVPVNTNPTLLNGTPSASMPLTLDGPLDFLGIALHPSTEFAESEFAESEFAESEFAESEFWVEVETWWQVSEGPITRPFSIMAHLITEEGMPLGAADGLGAWPLMLRTGDVIVQRHTFPPSRI